MTHESFYLFVYLYMKMTDGRMGGCVYRVSECLLDKAQVEDAPGSLWP